MLSAVYVRISRSHKIHGNIYQPQTNHDIWDESCPDQAPDFTLSIRKGTA
jgi:hypothetical protein